MFLGLDVPDDFSKPRGRTLSNKTTIIVKVPSEPFMRLCDIEHVEPVQDLGLGDVQKNLQYLKRHPDHGSEFLSHLWGLKFGGMVATSPLSAYLDLKHDREGIAGATSAFGEVLSKINQGDLRFDFTIKNVYMHIIITYSFLFNSIILKLFRFIFMHNNNDKSNNDDELKTSCNSKN